MKSKKKFLLLGVGVMGALAMGIGATSTFAWYQAQAGLSAINGNTNIAAASNVSVSATSDIETLNVTLVEGHFGTTVATHNAGTGDYADYTNEQAAATRMSAKLQLVRQVASVADPASPARIDHFYVDESGYLHSYEGEADLANYAIYKVNIEFTATTNLSAADAAAKAATKQLTVTLSNKVSDAENAADSTRLKSAFLTTADELTGDTTSAATTSALTSSVTQTVGYLLVWFDGGIGANGQTGGSIQNDGTNQLTGDARISLSWTAPQS